MGILDKLRAKKEDSQNPLFDLVYDLWENQSRGVEERAKKNWGYWNGDYKTEIEKLNDQTTTTCNIVKRIVEVKGSSALDAPFTIDVVPALDVFATAEKLKSMQDYADVLNAEVHNVLKENSFDTLKEIQMRRGLVVGLAPSQTSFDTAEAAEGRIKITDIDPINYRWDKNCTRPKDATFHAYLLEINPIHLKSRYAKNIGGSYDEELCKKIDELAETKTDEAKKDNKGVVNYQTTGGAGQAYVHDASGIKSGKIVKLVVMFLLDDSVYAPKDGETVDEKAVKEAGKSLYPYGRMILFAPDKGKKVIFDDKALPKGFQSLGNIDRFVPMDVGEMAGKDEVSDLIPVQDRINGAYAKLRLLIGSHINAVCLPEEMRAYVKEGSLVSQAVMYFRSYSLFGQTKKPETLNNGAIKEAIDLLAYIERLEQEAYRTARINETTLSGEQQVGTTSAAQVEALQSSPMSSIRMIQRNFKDWVISVGEKVVTLIQEHYTTERLVGLSSGMNGKYAKFGRNENGRYVEILDDGGKVISTIQIDPDWKFRVEVTAGLDIPRSRTEMAALTDRLVASPIMQSGDPEWADIYLRAQDYPYRREVVAMLRKRKEDAAKQPFTVKTLVMQPEMMKACAPFLEALQKAGRPEAIAQCLEMLGLSGKPGDLTSTPVQDVTSKSDVKDVVAVAEGKVSAEPSKDGAGREIAGAIIDKQHTKAVM